MPKPPLLRLFVVILLVASQLAARAEDDMLAVGALWSDFTSALRRGDYRRAHQFFSPESRAAMPFSSFASEYGPVSAAREMILAKPEAMSTRVDGEWAEIAFTGIKRGTETRVRVSVSLAKNQGAWGLVAGRNEDRERLEADARNILAAAARFRGREELSARLAGLVAALPENHPVAKLYRFEIDVNRIKAAPLDASLRAFHVDEWGMVKPGLTAAVPAPPPDPADVYAPAGGSAAYTRHSVSAPPPVFPSGPAAGHGGANQQELFIQPGGGLPPLNEPPLPGSMPEMAEPPSGSLSGVVNSPQEEMPEPDFIPPASSSARQFSQDAINPDLPSTANSAILDSTPPGRMPGSLRQPFRSEPAEPRSSRNEQIREPERFSLPDSIQ